MGDIEKVKKLKFNILGYAKSKTKNLENQKR
jgi:hypothetical protein